MIMIMMVRANTIQQQCHIPPPPIIRFPLTPGSVPPPIHWVSCRQMPLIGHQQYMLLPLQLVSASTTSAAAVTMLLHQHQRCMPSWHNSQPNPPVTSLKVSESWSTPTSEQDLRNFPLNPALTTSMSVNCTTTITTTDGTEVPTLQLPIKQQLQ